MNEANKAIVKSINSGQYFIDARMWYLDKFVGLHVEKTFLLIIAGLLIFAASISFLYASNMSSNVKQLTFLSYNNDIDNKYSYISSLPTNISPQLAVEERLIKLYVETRESFNLNNQDEINNYIKFHSSPTEYDLYLNSVSINNENNPFFTYGKEFTSSAKVSSIKFLSNQNQKEKAAVVNFDQTFYTKKQNHTIKSQVHISYNISDLEDLLNSDSKIIDFKITKYLAKIIN